MARNARAKIGYLAKGEAAKITDSPDTIRFNFVGLKKNLDVVVKELPKQILQIATVRGLAEKVRDEYALGADASDEDCYDAAVEMIGRLTEGEWLSVREGGGPRMTMLLAAIKEVREENGLPFDLEESRAKYVGTDDDTDEAKKAKAVARQNAAANEQVAVVLERMRAEAAAKKAAKTAPTATATTDL